jgi:hypothetical protein
MSGGAKLVGKIDDRGSESVSRVIKNDLRPSAFAMAAWWRIL